MSKRADSNSLVQQEMEKVLFEKIKQELKIDDLKRNSIIHFNKNKKSSIKPDFYSEKEKIIGEIHTHIGKLKGGQEHKLTNDILKMILFEKDRKKEFNKIIVICGEEENNYLQGNSFIAEAIRQFNILVHYYKMSETEKKKIQKAMEKQNLLK